MENKNPTAAAAVGCFVFRFVSEESAQTKRTNGGVALGDDDGGDRDENGHVIQHSGHDIYVPGANVKYDVALDGCTSGA